MTCFYSSTTEGFVTRSESEILAALQVGYAQRGYTTFFSDQTLSWERDISSLRTALSASMDLVPEARNWGIVLEFSIPRKEMRIDAVLLVGDVIVILEAKTGRVSTEGRRQIEEYALLLHYFHRGSARRRIVPVLVSPEAVEQDTSRLQQREFFPQLPTYWIAAPIESRWESLAKILLDVQRTAGDQMDFRAWEESPYFPVPSILEAALALRSGLAIREIAHSEASEHEINEVRGFLQQCVDQARLERRHIICFLTGVPGSGKTLVGLSLAHAENSRRDAVHFMSGNGPLVKVLQHLFTQESRRKGASAPQARTEARALIENVHVFARYHTEDNQGTPANHAIIFDEAQRAWNRAQNLRKFKRDYSEPEMLLNIMERHEDWAAVIALVGGGQEINDGEAGLEEWGNALTARQKTWSVYASPEVLQGGASTAGHRLFHDESQPHQVKTDERLHLRTSNRSLRAEDLATWVNRVLDGDAQGAAALRITARFPIFLSRSLDETRHKLRNERVGLSWYGLVGSSAAARLRAEGLEPSSGFHANYDWEHWYLAEDSDVRSSFRGEVFATEFEIQGLELDWIGLCWGGDFVWNPYEGWQLRTLGHGSVTKWRRIKHPDKRNYRRNAYRVLLTRARQGMVIFVPLGSSEDNTTDPAEYEATAKFLLECGVIPLSRPTHG